MLNFIENIGNYTTKNLCYDTRLRAGFNMMDESGDDLVFPDGNYRREGVDRNLIGLHSHMYKQEVKRYYKNKSCI